MKLNDFIYEAVCLDNLALPVEDVGKRAAEGMPAYGDFRPPVDNHVLREKYEPINLPFWIVAV